MAETVKKIQCPACAHELAVSAGADLAHLTCPHCEAEIPADAFRAEEEIAAEIAPGFRPGQQVGNYVIKSLLGSGGMAVVFLAKQLSLNRDVALKILPKESAENRMFVKRFESEAATLANLNHPNIVSVIDRGHEGDTYFIVMEYIEGETLKERLRRKERLVQEDIFPIAQQVLAGLGYAHRRGVVHRDIKPGNILINTDEVIKIADFGLAHLAKQEGGLDLTRDNQSMGTVKYMAPEQLTRAKYVDGRADLYSFGICLYEMLSGKLPVGTFKMPSEVDSSLDVRWDDIIYRVLKMEPEERYQDAGELARALEEMATTPHVSAQQVDLQEEFEEAKAREAAALNLTACAQCGHESPPAARTCEQCGASLEDIFEKCPSCGVKNRVDTEACPKCRLDLKSYRAKLRRAAEKIQTCAKELASEKHYGSAITELKKLLRFRTREYAAIRERAQVLIARFEKRRERHLEHVYEAGKRMIAERRLERALELWKPLRDEYQDVGKWRKDIAQRSKEAKESLRQGTELYKKGDYAGAVEVWQKAAEFWSQKNQLRQRIMRAKNKLGNLKLKQAYLRDAHAAQDSGNFGEVVELCRRALDLDPNDRDARALMRVATSKERETAAGTSIKPRTWKKVLARIGATIGILAVVTAVVAFIAFVYLPYMQTRRARLSERLLSEAGKFRTRGQLEEAVRACEILMQDYPQTHAATAAGELAAEMTEVIKLAKAARDSAEALAEPGGLAAYKAAFRRYEEILASGPLLELNSERVQAESSLEALRKQIGGILSQQAAEHERKGDWHAALKPHFPYKIAC